eukprot:6261999-Amphidinium_carterae.1
MRRELERSTATRRRPKGQIATPPLSKAAHHVSKWLNCSSSLTGISPEIPRQFMFTLDGCFCLGGGFCRMVRRLCFTATALGLTERKVATLLMVQLPMQWPSIPVPLTSLRCCAVFMVNPSRTLFLGGRNPTYTEEKVLLNIISSVPEAFRMEDGTILRCQAGALYV